VPPPPKITVKVEDLQDFNESVNWGIFGNSGVGKTVFSAFAPNAYFLSTEKGVVAAKRVGSTAKLLRAPDWEHVEASLDWADENLTLDDWLIIDSSSKMQILLIRWWLRMQNLENAARDLDVPQIQDHQKWQNMYMRFIDRIVDGNYNTILTATAMHKEDPEGETIVLPAITGKDYTIANYWCAAMDIVSHLAVSPPSKGDKNAPTVRRLLNETYPPYFAKDRYNVLPRYVIIEDGDYDIIDDLIKDIMELSPEERKAAKATAARA
jgi:hypothetical protein